jgi:hypothetical protein
MKSHYVALGVSSILFGLVAVAHLARVIWGTDKICVMVGSHQIGLMPSIVVIIAAGALSLWMGSLACAAKKAAQPPPPTA